MGSEWAMTLNPSEILDEIEVEHFKGEYATLVCSGCGNTLHGEGPEVQVLCEDCKQRLDYLYYEQK